MGKKEKTVKLEIDAHTELTAIGKKAETYSDIVKRLIIGHKSHVEVVAKIRALAGIARSHNIGNIEMMEQIKSLENEAIQLLGV